jgi:hypothetical protein
MKAILEFNLPEETLEHHDALHGTVWKLCLGDLDQELRNAQRYGHQFKDADEAVDHFRTRLHEIIAERGLFLE